MQGPGRALRVRHSARNLTGGGGLVPVRKLFDRLGLAGWIDRRTEKEKGFFRPGLMAEVGDRAAALRRARDGRSAAAGGPRPHRIFGWIRVPGPTTFGRWLRRSGERIDTLHAWADGPRSLS